MFILYGLTYNHFEEQSFRILNNRFNLNKNYLHILTSLPLPELLLVPKKKITFIPGYCGSHPKKEKYNKQIKKRIYKIL